MIEENFLPSNILQNMNKQNIFDDLLINMKKRGDNKRFLTITESNFFRILEEKVEMVDKINNELNGSNIDQNDASHELKVDGVSPLTIAKDEIISEVLPEIHRNAGNKQNRQTIKNKVGSIKKLSEWNVIVPRHSIALSEYCLTVTEPNQDQNQTTFSKTPALLPSKISDNKNHSKKSAYRKSISCRDVTLDRVIKIDGNHNRRIKQGNLNNNNIPLSYIHKADQDGASIQLMISQLHTKQSDKEAIRSQTPKESSHITAINYNKKKDSHETFIIRNNSKQITKKSSGDRNDVYTASKFAIVKEEIQYEPDIVTKPNLIFTDTISEFMKSIPHNLHKEAQQFIKLFRARLEKNSQIRNGIATTTNPGTLIPGSILDQIYTRCMKEFNISSEMNRVLNSERNRSLSKINIKKFEQLKQPDFLSEITSSKETSKKIFLYNKSKDPSNIDISKISNNLAYLNRKFFVDRYGYNYNDEPDFIFRDLCNDDTNDDDIFLKAEEKRNKKHLLVETYLDSTMKKKKELISHLKKNLSRTGTKITVKTLPPIKIK